MEEEIKDTLLHSEKEKEIRFSKPFKWVLAIAIGLTGILSLGSIGYLTIGISSRLWLSMGITFFLNQSLFYISILVCFIALINVAVVKRPFSKILVGCVMTIGILFVAASFIFPHIAGYETSGFVIFSNGHFTLIDGSLFLTGVLGILFAKIIQYGFLYQNSSDMTI